MKNKKIFVVEERHLSSGSVRRKSPAFARREDAQRELVRWAWLSLNSDYGEDFANENRLPLGEDGDPFIPNDIESFEDDGYRTSIVEG